MKRLILSAGVLLLLFAGSAHAIEKGTTFYFYGKCKDCKGTAEAQLTLGDYTLGESIDSTDFVSFTYDGTNLLAGFTITSSESPYVTGKINGPLPAAEHFYVSHGDSNFLSLSDGSWYVDFADTGSSSVWSASPTGVPEPATLTLIGTSLIGMRFMRRRRGAIPGPAA